MGARWLSALRRRLRWRARRIAGFLVLAGLSAALLGWARISAGFNRDLLLNIGASVIIVAFSYAIFDPLFEELRRSRVEEHPAFDGDDFSANVAGCSDSASIMDSGSHLLEGAGRERFLAAVRTAVGNGVTVRILLLDPDSPAAFQRAEEIRPVDVRKVITDNLRRLNEFAEQLPPDRRGRFQVRIYDASPSIQMFQWDAKALISFFPIGVRASAAPHLEVFMNSSLGEFVQGRFDELWRHPSTRSLEDYVCLPVTVRRGPDVLRACEVHFVDAGTAYCIDGSPMVDQLTDHGIRPLEIEAARPLTVDGWSGTSFRLARIDDHSTPDRAAVLRLFDRKYGPRPISGPGRARLALRLVPRLDDLAVADLMGEVDRTG